MAGFMKAHNWTPSSLSHLALLTQQNPYSGREWCEAEVAEGIRIANITLDSWRCKMQITIGGFRCIEGDTSDRAQYRRAELRGELSHMERLTTLGLWKGEWNGGWILKERGIPFGESYQFGMPPTRVITTLSAQWPDLASDLAEILERVKALRTRTREAIEADRVAEIILWNDDVVGTVWDSF